MLTREELEEKKRLRNAKILAESKRRMALVQGTNEAEVEMPAEFYRRGEHGDDAQPRPMFNMNNRNGNGMPPANGAPQMPNPAEFQALLNQFMGAMNVNRQAPLRTPAPPPSRAAIWSIRVLTVIAVCCAALYAALVFSYKAGPACIVSTEIYRRLFPLVGLASATAFWSFYGTFLCIHYLVIVTVHGWGLLEFARYAFRGAKLQVFAFCATYLVLVGACDALHYLGL